MSNVCGNNKSPKRSVDSKGSCVGILSKKEIIGKFTYWQIHRKLVNLPIEQTKTPGPLKLFVSLLLSASYRQNGISMFVHSFINSMEPPGSAEISQMANILWGNGGAPKLYGSQGVFAGLDRVKHKFKLRRKKQS